MSIATDLINSRGSTSGGIKSATPTSVASGLIKSAGVNYQQAQPTVQTQIPTISEPKKAPSVIQKIGNGITDLFSKAKEFNKQALAEYEKMKPQKLPSGNEFKFVIPKTIEPVKLETPTAQSSATINPGGKMTPENVASAFPQTSQAVDELFKYKAEPNKILNDAWSAIKDPAIEFYNRSKAVDQPSKSKAESVAKNIKLVTGAVNVAFSPFGALLSASKNVPVLGKVINALMLPFVLAGEGASKLSDSTIDSLDIPQQTKDELKPAVAEVASLAVQIALGKAIEPAVIRGNKYIKQIGIEKFNQLTKDVKVAYNLPKGITIDKATLRQFYIDDAKLSPEIKQSILDLNLSSADRAKALKSGVDVTIPLQKITTISDKPYWSKVKDIFKLPPAIEEIMTTANSKAEVSMKSLPAGEYTGEQIRNKIISSPIQDTAEGKALIKASIQADQTGKSIEIAPPADRSKLNPNSELYVPPKPKTVVPSSQITPKVESSTPKVTKSETIVKTSAKPVDLIEKQITTTKDIKSVKSTLKNIQKELNDAIAEAEGKSIVAKEQRSGLETERIAKLKRIASLNKEYQAGNWDVIKEKHGNLVDAVVEDVQRNHQELGYDEALYFALNLPTKAQEGVRTTAIRELETKQKKLAKYLDVLKSRQTELSIKTDAELQKQWEEVLSAQEKLMKIVEVPRTQIPIGEGKVKVSKLESRVKKTLDNLSPEQIDQLGLSTYKAMNNKETIRNATEYVLKNPEEALKVIAGEILPPKGLNQNAVYVAMVNNSIGNVELATKLASVSSTAGGQNIEILKEIDPNSPVKIMSEVIKIKETAFKNRYGNKAKEITNRTVKEIKNSIKKPDKWDWALFLDELACKT